MNYFYEFSNVYEVKVHVDESCEVGTLGYVADFKYPCRNPEFIFDSEDRDVLIARDDFSEFLLEHNADIRLSPITLRGRNLKISHAYLKAEIPTSIELDMLNAPSSLMLDRIPGFDSKCFDLLVPMIYQDDPIVSLGRRREETGWFPSIYLMREDALEKMFERFESLRETRHLWWFEGYMKMGEDYSWFPGGQI